MELGCDHLEGTSRLALKKTGWSCSLGRLMIGGFGVGCVGDELPVFRRADHDLSEGPEIEGLGKKSVLEV